MPEPGRLAVTVVCAWPDATWQRRLSLAPGSTVADALAASGWREQLLASGRLSAEPQVGIFGRPAAPTQRLHDGDRIELYRPLLADPRTVRRRRAADGR